MEPTPSQTVGPFFHFSLTTEAHSVRRIAGPKAKGERIWVCCRVFDGEGAPLDDAMIEIWQADAEGDYPQPPADSDFGGFGRLATGEDGSCEFETIKPGRVPTPQSGQNRPSLGTPVPTPQSGQNRPSLGTPVPMPGGARQAPHLEVAVFARGMLKQLFTRIYFTGDAANEEDPVLALVPEDRRETLMAHSNPARPALWRFDIHLQGDEETVFFDV